MQIRAVGTEAVKLRNRQELSGYPFDNVCETGDFTVVGDGQNVDFQRDEYHARLAKNYVTWVRRYVAPEPPPPHSPEDLAGKPITWTIGGLNPAGMFFDNVVLAVKSGCPISLLMCKHFPQVSAAGMLAEHIRASALGHQRLGTDESQ